jgi:hypothetical protein
MYLSQIIMQPVRQMKRPQSLERQRYQLLNSCSRFVQFFAHATNVYPPIFNARCTHRH